MAAHLFVGPEGDVLGVVENMPGARLHIAWDEELAYEWWLALDHETIPEDDTLGIAISEAGLLVLIGAARPGNVGELVTLMPEGDEDGTAQPLGYRLGPKGIRFCRCADPVYGFREFLRIWHFLDQDNGRIKLLGEVLWKGQEHFVQMCREHNWIYFLKARQLGETTIAIAYDGWVLRFRTVNARVHLVARIEQDAKDDLLLPLKAGLDALPEEMLLPEDTNTTTSLVLDAGPGDKRRVFAYPAKEPGRGKTCSHLHLEEWAAMMKTSPDLPKNVWAAAEPTISKQGGTCHILTTGVGPFGYYADTWKQCEKGVGQLFAAFIGAAGSRPEYTPEWLEAKRIALADDAKFKHEYPETAKDALAGAGDTYFTSYELDKAGQYARGIAQIGTPRERPGAPAMFTHRITGKLRKRKYIKAWDIAGPGDESDAVVGTVLDVTEPVWDVVLQEVYHGEDYPTTAYRIETMHAKWKGLTVIEDNSAGAAVRAFLKLPEEEVKGFTTTRQSKPQIISEVKYALSAQILKWNPEECKELDTEMRYYKLADENIAQDCVMSLAIAVHHGADDDSWVGGRVLAVSNV